jgi:hypothetical protein
MITLASKTHFVRQSSRSEQVLNHRAAAAETARPCSFSETRPSLFQPAAEALAQVDIAADNPFTGATMSDQNFSDFTLNFNPARPGHDKLLGPPAPTTSSGAQ